MKLPQILHLKHKHDRGFPKFDYNLKNLCNIINSNYYQNKKQILISHAKESMNYLSILSLENIAKWLSYEGVLKEDAAKKVQKKRCYRGMSTVHL